MNNSRKSTDSLYATTNNQCYTEGKLSLSRNSPPPSQDICPPSHPTFPLPENSPLRHLSLHLANYPHMGASVEGARQLYGGDG